MNAHPIDTEALRARAEHVYRHGGPANAVESLAANIPEILDRLAAAEHRATRAEAQSAIRGRAVVMYRERAREAEAEVKRLSRKCGHLADKYDTEATRAERVSCRREARAALSAARHARTGCPECGRHTQHKMSCSRRDGRGWTIPMRGGPR